MNNQINYMKECSLLRALSTEEIHSGLCAGSFRICSYHKNSIVHFSGDTCSKLEIILSGNIVVERIDESGNLMTIAEFFGDDILGGNLLFSKNPYYPMTITARQPASILEIEKERLFTLFSDNHDFLRRYLEYVSDHVVILGDRIKHYVNKTIRESLMSYFDYERKNQQSDNIRLTITKKALAEKIGVQRTSLSRELAKMEKDGLILFNKDSITVLY